MKTLTDEGGMTNWSSSLPAVHVHCVWLPLRPTEVRRFWPMLSPKEAKRADSLRDGETRDHFVALRGILRLLLGRYLGETPQSIPITALPGQKPIVPGAGLHFSASRCNAMGLFAFSRNTEVGVDIESVDDGHRPHADYALCPQEYAALLRTPVSQRARFFMRKWVQKEAFVKALGCGLYVEPASFELMGADGAWCVRTADGVVRPIPWTLHTFAPSAAHVAAVVSAPGSALVFAYDGFTSFQGQKHNPNPQIGFA